MTLGKLVSDDGCELQSRRAAKRHYCFLHENAFTLVEPSDDCTGTIEPGDLYIENMDTAPAYQSGTRYCVPCAVEQFGIDPGLIGDERGEGPPEAGDMEKTDGLGADEDRIEDEEGRRIGLGVKVRVVGGKEAGEVVKVRSCSDRDGHPPNFDVVFPACPEAPETFGTTVRDFRAEGPDGPFVYVGDDVVVVD